MRYTRQRRCCAGEDTMTKQISMLIVLACLINLSTADSSMADELMEEGVRKCITTRTLKSTAVIDDWNILFMKAGNTIYHNILPRRCKGLSKYRQFTYTTLSGSLCNFDNIQIPDDHSRNGRFCRLGVFYEVTIEDIPDIVKSLYGPTVTRPKPQPPARTEEIIVEDDEPGEPMLN